MRNTKISFLFTLLIFPIFSSCNMDCIESEKENTFSGRVSEIDEFKRNNPFLDEYRSIYGELMFEVNRINSKKNKADIDSLVINYQRVLTSTSNDSALFKEKLIQSFNSIYSKSDIKNLNTLLNKFKKVEKEVFKDKKFLLFNSHEKNLFVESFALEIPKLKNEINIINIKTLKTRSESDNSACIDKCKDSYRWGLLFLASSTICAGGASILEACMSVGTLSIPALIQLITGYSLAMIEFDRVTLEYNTCVSDCKNKQ